MVIASAFEAKGYILKNVFFFFVFCFCLFFYQCCKQGIGEEEQWIQSLVVAGEPTVKNGGVRGMW
jgi:hypothetical protein